MITECTVGGAIMQLKPIDVRDFPEGTNLKTTLPHLTNTIENLHIFKTTTAFCDVFDLF